MSKYWKNQFYNFNNSKEADLQVNKKKCVWFKPKKQTNKLLNKINLLNKIRWLISRSRRRHSEQDSEVSELDELGCINNIYL